MGEKKKNSGYIHLNLFLTHSLFDPNPGSVFRCHGNIFFFPEVPYILVSNVLYNKALNREEARVFAHISSYCTVWAVAMHAYNITLHNTE